MILITDDASEYKRLVDSLCQAHGIDSLGDGWSWRGFKGDCGALGSYLSNTIVDLEIAKTQARNQRDRFLRIAASAGVEANAGSYALIEAQIREKLRQLNEGQQTTSTRL